MKGAGADPGLKVSGSKLPALTEAATLAIIAICIWASVLNWIYPRFLDPFWPNHSDYYIPLTTPYEPAGWADILVSRRPVATLLMAAFGIFGIQGAMIGMHAVVLANIVLTAILVRRWLKLSMNAAYAAGFAVFVFAVLTHPYQYAFSTYDTSAGIAFLFLTLALITAERGPMVLVAALLLLSALSKETYYAAAVLVAIGIGIWREPRPESATERFSLAIAVALTELAALAFSLIARSEFGMAGGGAGSPYEINLQPGSLAMMWARYARDAMPVWCMIFVAIGVAALLCTNREARNRIAPVLWLMAASVFVWLPNSIFPNHYFPGYSWEACYWLFAGLLALPFVLPQNIVAGVTAAASAAIVLLAPLSYGAEYTKSDWSVAQQKRQKVVLQTLASLFHFMPQSPRKILITGLNFPFSPFDHPLSLYSLGASKHAQFDVTAYAPLTDGTPSRIAQRVSVAQARARERLYDETWMFGGDGNLIRRVAGPAPISQDPFQLGAETMRLYPGLIALVPQNRTPDGAAYLSCGALLAADGALPEAEQCLTKSITLMSGNAYPYFYLAQIAEQRGQWVAARANYAEAVKRDDAKNPNPAFAAGLARASAH